MARTGKRSHHQLTLAVLLLGVSSYALLQSLVLPVLPTIQHSLRTSQNTVTWVLTAYLLSASIFTPILGRIGDMHGKERMFVVTLVALGIGSFLAAIASSIDLMIVARVIQGIGGGVLPLAFGIIRDEFPKEKVGGAVGITAALLAVGGGFGIVLAGPIVDSLNYHWLFWIPMIMVIIAAVAAHLVIPESPVRTPGRISWGAAALLSAWLTAALVAVSEAPSWHWLSVRVIGLAVLSVVLIAAWILVELRSKEPLIDMRMMRIPAVWTTNLVAALFGIGMYSLFAFLPEFVQTPISAGYGFGASITKSGLFLLPMSCAMFFLGLISGKAARAIGSKIVLTIGATISVFPMALLTIDHKQQWVIYLIMGLLGAGFGLAFSAMSSLIVESVPASQTGVASGMNANIRTIGGSLGAAVMASIVTSHAQSNGIPIESGYSHGFLFLTIAGAAAAIACIAIPKSRLAKDEAHEELSHAELALLAAGTLTGDESE